MPNEGFMQRWSRLKTEGSARADLTSFPDETQDQLRAGPHDQLSEMLPTLADAANLTAESDYSAFVARGIDPSVRRLAMKKLFADPHFNVIDGLDIYMADYNLPDPVSPAMLASLAHGRNLFGQVIEEALEDDAPLPAPPAQESE